jgi:hypothetical protein
VLSGGGGGGGVRGPDGSSSDRPARQQSAGSSSPWQTQDQQPDQGMLQQQQQYGAPRSSLGSSVWLPWRVQSNTLSELGALGSITPGATPPAAAAGGWHDAGSKRSMIGALHRPRNMWLLQQLLGPRQEQQRLFRGLRVRMGVATGEVARGSDLKGSSMYRRAQGEQLVVRSCWC